MIPAESGVFMFPFTHRALREREGEKGRNAEPVAKMTGHDRDADTCFMELTKSCALDDKVEEAREGGMAGYRFRISARRRRGYFS